MSTCRSCAAPVTFLKTTTGSWMIVEGIVSKTRAGPIFDPSIHTPHWGNCPDAKLYRKRNQTRQEGGNGNQSNRR